MHVKSITIHFGGEEITYYDVHISDDDGALTVWREDAEGHCVATLAALKIDELSYYVRE